MAGKAVRRFRGIAVVGAGAAGVSAAVEAVRLGAGALVLDCAGAAGGVIGLAFEVRNFPGGVKSGGQVAGMFHEQLRQWGIPLERRLVSSVAARSGLVRLEDGEGWVLEADGAVVATGTVPVMPEVRGLPASFEPGGGVFPSALSALAGGIPPSAAVIGGSDVAFDQARLLASHGVETSVVCRRRVPSAPPWLVEAALNEGVALRAGLEVADATRRQGGWRLVTSVRGEAGSAGPEIEAGSVVVAAGRKARLPLISGSPHSLVKVAGDAAGRPGRYLCAAMADGCLASRDILGGRS